MSTVTDEVRRTRDAIENTLNYADRVEQKVQALNEMGKPYGMTYFLAMLKKVQKSKELLNDVDAMLVNCQHAEDAAVMAQIRTLTVPE